jgi:hypothetical protein
LQPPALIPGKFQQKFPFVATMGNMPYMPGRKKRLALAIFIALGGYF